MKGGGARGRRRRPTSVEERAGGADMAPATAPHDPRTPQARLGELLVRRDALEAATVADALALQTDDGRRLGEILVDLDLLTESELASALAEQAGPGAAGLSPVPRGAAGPPPPP